MSQINSFVKQYAEQEGYDIILGTTQSGSLLYANNALDITEEIVEALNQYYKQ